MYYLTLTLLEKNSTFEQSLLAKYMTVPAEICFINENQKIMIYRWAYHTHDGCYVHLYFEKVNAPHE